MNVPRNRRITVPPAVSAVPPTPPRSLAWRASLVMARCAIVAGFITLCVILDNI